MTERKPDWIRYKIPGGREYTRIKKIIQDRSLNTICLEANCPNIGECFNCGTATFLILGDVCTRNCRYCAVHKGIPAQPDPLEPAKISEAVNLMNLKYAVITSVTRDDLPDGGAAFFVETCNSIREKSPGCKVELLVPDFKGSMQLSLEKITESAPDVLNHNIEVVKNLFKTLRPSGSYDLSLSLLKKAADSGLKTKSGLMIGFGETLDDIKQTIDDLKTAGCSMLTVGQYLKATKKNSDVYRYYHPDEFAFISEYAYSAGFEKVLSGPLVRSSYHAGGLHG